MFKNVLCAIAAAAISFVGLTTTANAHDTLPPSWRYMPGTTVTHVYEWLPLADQQQQFNGYYYIDYFDATDFSGQITDDICDPTVRVLDKDGQIKLTPSDDKGFLIIEEGEVVEFEICNFPNYNPRKDIRLQVTLDQRGLLPLGFSGVYGHPGRTGELIDTYNALADDLLVEVFPVPGDDNLLTFVYDWSLFPNPWWETILLQFGQNPNNPSATSAIIDQVVIDTRCIPEPSTLGLLALAGLSLIRRR